MNLVVSIEEANMLQIFQAKRSDLSLPDPPPEEKLESVGYFRQISNRTMNVLKSKKVNDSSVRSAKFIARKQWFVAGADDNCIHVYNYQTMAKVKVFLAHLKTVRSLAVHPTLSHLLSSSGDTHIKIWDWERDWSCAQIFWGHSGSVTQVTFNPKDTSTFASASLDNTIKIWKLDIVGPIFSMADHYDGVTCLDYYTINDNLYIISGSADTSAKVGDGAPVKFTYSRRGKKTKDGATMGHPG